MDAVWYKTIIMWMQCAFGVMLGTELIWKKLRSYGKALVVTTLTQSLGTFAVVSLAFGIIFSFLDIPVFLAFVFGGIALATAPAPALSIVNEFHAKGPVTDTLLPMTVLDDVVGIVVFFTVNSLVARKVSKDAGLIDVCKEGTKNFYYFDSDMKSMKKLIHALQNAVNVASQLPDRKRGV